MKIASALSKGLFNIILVICLFMRAFSTKHIRFLYVCQMFKSGRSCWLELFFKEVKNITKYLKRTFYGVQFEGKESYRVYVSSFNKNKVLHGYFTLARVFSKGFVEVLSM